MVVVVDAGVAPWSSSVLWDDDGGAATAAVKAMRKKVGWLLVTWTVISKAAPP